MKRDRRNELHRRLQRTEAALSAYRRAADPDVLDQIHRSGGSFGRGMLLATIRAQEVELAEIARLRAQLAEYEAREKLWRKVARGLLPAWRSCRCSMCREVELSIESLNLDEEVSDE